MAIAPLEQRVDDLVQQDQTAPPDLKAEADAAQETLLEPVELTPSTQEFETTQVAGLPGALKEVFRAPKRTQIPIAPPGADRATVGPYQVMPDAPPQRAEDVLQEAPMMPSSGKPSPRPGVAATVTNLDNIVGPDALKQFIEATGRKYGADRLTRMKFSDVASKAISEGYDEAFVAGIIDPAKATQANPQDAYKMLMAVADAGKVAFELGEKVKAAKTAGTLTPELAAQFRQALAVEGVLLSAARGRQADIARTLGIFRMARDTTGPQRGQLFETILNEAGGIESVHDLAKRYTALDSRSGRAQLAQKSLAGTAVDIWMSTWINGLLSAPMTHVINTTSSALFSGYSVIERAGGSLVGKLRNIIRPGGEQAIDMDEVYAMALGFVKGMQEGGIIAGKAFVKNEPSDPLSKIESVRAGRDPFNVDMGNSMIGQTTSKALKYYGSFVTLPGRAIMAEDEFIKAIGYRMQLNALATRQGTQEYRRLVQQGIAPQQAVQQAQQTMRMILDPNTTPADIDAAAKEFGRVVTFNKELEQSLQGVQKFLQNPLMKMFVPFVRTPTNIALETMARTPAFLGSPRFWADWNAGGVRRDMAISRAGLGSGLVLATGAFALDGKLTGYGPMRTEDKKLMEATGWQPYSVVFSKKDVSPTLLAEFKKLSTVTEGPDKYYVSYARLEPISTLLAVGATAGEYAQMTPGDSDMDQLFLGGALGLYQYLSDQPMLAGFSQMTEALTSDAKTAPEMFADILRASAKQVGGVVIGGAPVLGQASSSFAAAIERYMDPEKSLTMAPEMGRRDDWVNAPMRGFWEAMQQAKNRNPLTSDKLRRDLDPITGEVRKVGNGNLYEMFDPFKRSDGKFSPAHVVLQEYGVPLYRPEKTIEGVMLSDSQYYRLIEIATKETRLAENIVALGKSKDLRRQAAFDLEKAQSVIQTQISETYSFAKKRLLEEDAELRNAVQNVLDAKKIEGKFKR